jgi:hypothetical protein
VFVILVTRIARAARRNKIDPWVAALGHIYICNGANETQKVAGLGPGAADTLYAKCHFGLARSGVIIGVEKVSL